MVLLTLKGGAGWQKVATRSDLSLNWGDEYWGSELTKLTDTRIVIF